VGSLPSPSPAGSRLSFSSPPLPRLARSPGFRPVCRCACGRANADYRSLASSLVGLVGEASLKIVPSREITAGDLGPVKVITHT
jgi:hypothetical protein